MYADTKAAVYNSVNSGFLCYNLFKRFLNISFYIASRRIMSYNVKKNSFPCCMRRCLP